MRLENLPLEREQTEAWLGQGQEPMEEEYLLKNIVSQCRGGLGRKR